MDKEKLKLTIGLAVWLICAIFYMFELFLRTIVGTFQAPIMHDLGLTTLTFALISSTSYQIAYGCMQVPVGLITDKFGLKKTLVTATLLCTIAAIGFSLASGFTTAISWRVFMGLGSSFGFVCLLVAVYDWLPKKNIALFIGISQFIGTLGPMLAAGPLHSVAQTINLNWRALFLGLGVFGLSLAVLVFLLVKNNRDKEGQYSFTVLNRAEPLRVALRKLFSQKAPWIIALVSGGIYFAIEYFSENETQQYLALYGYSTAFATYLITTAWMGYALGCPLLGLISDYFRRRKLPIVLSGLAVLLALVGIIYFAQYRWLLTGSFFVLGIGCGGQSIGFVMMAEYCENNYLAAGLGLNNAALLFFTAASAPLVGQTLIFLNHGVGEVFNVHQYHLAFSWLLGLVGFVVLIALLFLKETFAKSQKELTILTRQKIVPATF